MNDQYYNFTMDRMLNKYLNYVAHYLWEDFHIGIENVDTDRLLQAGSVYMNDDRDPRTCAKDYYDEADDKLLAKAKRKRLFDDLAKIGSAIQEGSKNKTKTKTTTTKTNTIQKENETMAQETTTTKNLNISKKIDVAGMIKVKMAETMMKKDGDVDFGKMMMMDAFDENGQIDISKMMQAKMMGTLMGSLEKNEDIPLEKLMMIQMIQSGNFDLNQVLMMKMMDKLFTDDKKETK